MTTKPPGRPPINGKPMRRVTVYLNPDHILWAAREGHGNLSDGVRQLLDELSDLRAWHHAQLDPHVVAGPRPRGEKHQ